MVKYEKLKKYCGEKIKVLADKDLEIAALKQQQHLLNDNKQQHVRQNVDLSAYRQIFTNEQIKQLQNINHNTRGDSSFVRKIVHFLYGHCEIREIPTMRCRLKYAVSQHKMPDDIRDLIEAMLSIRLTAVTSEPHEYLFRLKKNSVHISQALLQLVYAKSK